MSTSSVSNSLYQSMSTGDTGLISGRITINGLGTGSDMTAVVDQLVEVESIQKSRLEYWKTTWEAKITSMRGLNQRLSAIQEASDVLSNSKTFYARKISVSNSTVLSAQVNNDANIGASKIIVGGGDDHPIKHILRSAGWADAGTTPCTTAGTLKLEMDGEVFEIDLDGTESLNDLAQKINDVTGDKIIATVANDGTSSKSHYLKLIGSVGGDKGMIKIVQNPTLMSLDDKHMAVQENNLGVGASLGGQFTGNKAQGLNAYNFTIQNVSGSGQVGTDSFDVVWTKTNADGTTTPVTINVPAGYVPGDDIVIEGGVVLNLSGTVTEGQTMAQNVYNTSPVYTFTVQNAQGAGEIGTDQFELVWTKDCGNGASTPVTITVPADYKPGQAIYVEDGMYLRLEAGNVADGQTLVVRGYSDTIDEAELGEDWTGPAVSTSGNYTGAVNKYYRFVVEKDGELNGNSSYVLRWADSMGGSGTVTIKDPNVPVEVEQGVFISLDQGSLTKGQTFTVDVFAANEQLAQDKGLAQSAKAIHSGFADTAITPVTTTNGTFTYNYGGTTVSLAVEAGTTMSQLINMINSDKNNPGIVASVINDGLGLPTSYKMVLTGKNSGAQWQITNVNHNFTGSNFSGSGDLGGGFDLTQKATNSMVKVDGYPAGDTVYLQRPTNQISDLITGVNLSLTDIGESVLTVDNDIDAIYDNIVAFINAVNYAQSYIREATRYADTEEGEKEAGVMIGNYAYYILKSRIDSALNASVGGLDGWSTLAQIGIGTDPNNEGMWVIDSTARVAGGLTLREALSQDLDAVAKLFINDENTGTQGVAARMHTEMKAQTASRTSEDGGGMLNVLIGNYQDIIANIDKKIASEERRIELYRERQLARFARLETAMSELNSQASALESAIEQLPNSNSK